MTNALRNSIARLGAKLDDHKKDAVPMNVSLDSLVPYARQVRKKFDQESLEEMAASIKELGVMVPLLVRPADQGKYEIIAGERRFRAAHMAGLSHVPVLVRAVDDDRAHRMHWAENTHRDNLKTLELALGVQAELDANGGDLATVAATIGKSKPWISRLSAIAQGGESMVDLIENGVTSDRVVLATVSSLERKAPEQAKALRDQLKAAPTKSDKRSITEKFMQGERASKPKPAAKTAKTPKWLDDQRKADAERHAGEEPAWRGQQGLAREVELALIAVELSPMSAFADEFAQLSKQAGAARLAAWVRHPDSAYAVVEFGNTGEHQRNYRADELRLLAVC